MDFDRVANTPIDVLAVAVPDSQHANVTHQKRLKAAALPMGRAMAWMKEAEALEKRLLAQEDGVLDDVLDFVCEYSPDWPADSIRVNAAPAQIVNAFYLLKELNDPFAVAKQKREEATERGLRMLEALGKTGSSSINSLIDKHLKEASADSAKSLE